jgi:5'-3' exonuclease
MATSFKTMAELDPEIVLVVDSLNLAFRWKHKGQFDFLEDYIRTIESLRKSYKAGKVIIACDSGASSYRKSIFPGYKQGRKEKQLLATPEEQAEFELFFQGYLDVIESYKESTHYPVFKFDKTEADDIGAYIVKFRSKYKVKKIVLASSDKDWDLLVNDDVMRFSYVTRKETRIDNWNEHYDYAVDEHISIKCLTGDSGDSIPGVPDVGEKRAIGLVKTYGTAYDIAANLPIASKYKYMANLNTFGADNLLLNYRLMDLMEFCDEALGPINCEVMDEILRKYLNGSSN